MDIPGTGRLRSFHTLEQLSKHPHQGIIILTSKHLGHEMPSLPQKLSRQLQRLEHQLILRKGILHPCGTDVGRTVMQDEIGFPVVQVRSNHLSTLRRGNV